MRLHLDPTLAPRRPVAPRRIGILTGGGDAPGLNAVIRAVVKAAVGDRGWELVGIEDSFNGLFDDPRRLRRLDLRSGSGLLHLGGTLLGTTNRGDPFAFPDGKGGQRDRSAELAAAIREEGLEGLIIIGGDGTQRIGWRMMVEHGIPVIGVPKTIDNDLGATAFTFGFDSAVATATDALDRLHTTAASHERVMVLEVMGRHAGWIALHAGIAGGGDVILLPEIDWDFEHVCRAVQAREAEGKRYTLVVVAEGARLPGGVSVHAGDGGQRRQVRLGGVGEVVAGEIAKRLNREVRAVVLGHLQRGGPPTTFDRVLATQFGAHAVRLVHEGRFGEMVCYRPPDIASVPIAEAVSRLSQVDVGSSAVLAARALGISFGDDLPANRAFAG